MTGPRLIELSTFAKVVETGSFTAAGQALNLPKSTVSRRISALEDHLGARLLARTTRRLNVTDIGREVYRHAARALSEAEEAERLVGRLQEAPRGLLRVTTTVTFGRTIVGPILPIFLRQYPDLRIAVDLSARPVDLLQEGYDVAIRARASAADNDPTILTRNLIEAEVLLCASPAYIAARGRPETPLDLTRHSILAPDSYGSPTTWRMTWNGQPHPITITPRLSVNDPVMMLDSCRMGLGLAWLPHAFAEQDLARGTLVQVMPDAALPPISVDALYPRHAAASAKVRLFLEHLSEQVASLIGPAATCEIDP